MSVRFLILRLANLYSLVIILRAVLSWTPLVRNPVYGFLVSLTEPLLRPLRELVPPERTGGIDISPILALVAINLVVRLLFSF
jgi:YggT family protein